MTSLEGRVLRRRRAVDAPGGRARSCGSGASSPRRLGAPGTWDTDAALVFDELARASAGGRADYSGLSHARLDAEPDLYWPCPATDGEPHPGTPRLFLDAFPTPDGRARFVAVDDAGPADDVRRRRADPPGDRPRAAALPVGRADPPRRRARRRLARGVRRDPPRPRRPPRRRGRATSSASRARAGSVTAPARLTDSGPPRHRLHAVPLAGRGSVNRVTNDATDPVSGMPEFKVCAVDVARADRPHPVPAAAGARHHHGGPGMRLVVVGNGMVGVAVRRGPARRATTPASTTSPSSAPRGASPTTASCSARSSPGRHDLAVARRCPRPTHPRLSVLPGHRGSGHRPGGPRRRHDRREPAPLRPARPRHRRRGAHPAAAGLDSGAGDAPVGRARPAQHRRRPRDRRRHAQLPARGRARRRRARHRGGQRAGPARVCR